MNNNECGNNYNVVLNPYFVTGLTNAEGCFSVVRKYNKVKFNFYKYPLYGTKKIKLNKLLLVRELKRDNKHLMVVGRSRHWKPDIKLRIIEIWKN